MNLINSSTLQADSINKGDITPCRGSRKQLKEEALSEVGLGKTQGDSGEQSRSNNDVKTVRASLSEHISRVGETRSNRLDLHSRSSV